MIGSKLAHYEITSHLGSGGMGEVYQATDGKLGRSVAIKILPEAFARDADRLARFEREARVLASLNHPNIAAIYGLEQSASQNFLVMELVGGETLAERIKRGPIPVDESLGIAKQIAEALEAAHESGVIHRDLKPANIKITPDGRVKVLDFGLAKAMENTTSSSALSNSPTLSMAATNAGVILGTAAYMSPEQAKGRNVDRRTDIFAFGCVLYEMLTGQRAFDGEDVTDILGAVLRMEPDWTRLPSDVVPAVRKLLRLCLEKNAKNRRSDAADVRLDIEQALADPASIVGAVYDRPPTRNTRLAWVVAAGAVLVAGVSLVLLGMVYFRPAPEVAAVRFSIAPPEDTVLISSLFASYILSPNGRQLAMIVASPSGVVRISVRSLDALEARPLAGTEGVGGTPFWSPDSRFIGFLAQGKLKKIELAGGPAQTLCDAPGFIGGTWNRDGIIIFGTNPGPLMQVSSAGGKPAPLTTLDRSRGEQSHMWPYLLPDGDHFLYLSRAAQQENNAIYVASLQSKDVRMLINANSRPLYSPPGYLIFVREGTLMAQPFNAQRLEIGGEQFPVAERLRYNPSNGAAGVTVSENGTLAFRSEGGFGEQQLVWFDRAGKQLGTLGPLSSYRNPEISPDGTRVAVERADPQNQNLDIWIMEVMRDVSTRFTFDAAEDIYPIWSPDGNQIVFSSARAGNYKMYQKLSSGGEQEQVLLDVNGDNVPRDWSSDGRFIVYTLPGNPRNLESLPLFGDKKPISYLKTNFNITQPQFSTDGRWMAYASNESGQGEIYIQSFPEPHGKLQVSTAGGQFPRWRLDGKELFYLAPDEKLMAVSIDSKGASLQFSNPVPLFETHLANAGFAAISGFRHQYDVTADGQRFLMNTASKQTAEVPITVVLNWTAGLKK